MPGPRHGVFALLVDYPDEPPFTYRRSRPAQRKIQSLRGDAARDREKDRDRIPAGESERKSCDEPRVNDNHRSQRSLAKDGKGAKVLTKEFHFDSFARQLHQSSDRRYHFALSASLIPDTCILIPLSCDACATSLSRSSLARSFTFERAQPFPMRTDASMLILFSTLGFKVRFVSLIAYQLVSPLRACTSSPPFSTINFFSAAKEVSTFPETETLHSNRSE